MTAETIQHLEHHWAMDPEAANMLASRLPVEGHQHIQSIVDALDPNAVVARDISRGEANAIIEGSSTKMWLTFGPCSTDKGVKYEALHDLRAELIADFPDWHIEERLVSDKPRSGKGWRGLLNSVDVEERRQGFSIIQHAFNLGIPLSSDVTESFHIGSLAPYASTFWVGTRDMQSSALRGAFSAIPGISVEVKNSNDGGMDTMENAIKKIGSTTHDNDGSGVSLGTIAMTPDHLGYPTGILPVSTGNKRVGIIARGYELPRSMDRGEREAAVFKHISGLCRIAYENGTVVRLDLNHQSPKMFAIPGLDEKLRPITVMERIVEGIESGRVEHAERLSGFMCEIGPVEGRTDPNWIIDRDTAKQLGEMMLSLRATVGV